MAISWDFYNSMTGVTVETKQKLMWSNRVFYFCCR